jgi:Asp/Glu/hydantoin racemase
MFRIAILSPLKATEDDLARRQQRYQTQAGPETVVTVHNLDGGPAALNTSGDILASAAAIYAQGEALDPAAADAILIDCVFDPAVAELEEATGLPVFGPTRATLPLMELLAPNFSVIARSPRQCELLEGLIHTYGYGDRLCSVRALDITYPEARQPAIFNRVMAERLRTAIQEDGAQAIFLGSTTMAISDEMRAAAGTTPLLMPGMLTLGLMETFWRAGLLAR